MPSFKNLFMFQQHGSKYFVPQERVAGEHTSSGDVSRVLSMRFHGGNHKAAQKLETRLCYIDRYYQSVIREE